MEVVTELSRSKPDENAAEEIEQEVSQKLCRRDPLGDGNRVGNALVEIDPDGAQADVYHLPSDDGLHTVPSDRCQDSVEDREICSPHPC